jgi:hypothetical protein
VTSASGTYRPSDWAPLADSDPVPGDPAGIRDEADHMKRVAQWLREQAADLRVIGHGDDQLRGEYADRLRGNALDLEMHLREVAERYEHVHGQLTSWSDELADFQDESVRLLRNARAAEDHATTPSAAPARPDDPVRPYRVSLRRLTDHRDERAAHYAKRIGTACDDIIRDSRWESLSDTVGDVLDDRWLNDLLNVLGIVVSLVGVITLFCTPVGWIITACTVVGITMAAKDVLAAATGHGSWFDVGLDTVGFLGGFALARALKSLKAIRAATKLASEAAAAERAASRVLRGAEGAIRNSYRVANSRTASGAARASARQVRGVVRGRAEAAGHAARAAEHVRPMPEPSRTETALAGGEKEAAAQYKDINAMRSRYPGDPAVQRASRHAGTAMGTVRGVVGTNAVVDWGGNAAGAWSSDYARLEDKYTMALGSQW